MTDHLDIDDRDDCPATWESELSTEEAAGLELIRDRVTYALRDLVGEATAILAATETLWQLGHLLRTAGFVVIPGIGTVTQDGDTRELEPPRDLMLGADEEGSE